MSKAQDKKQKEHKERLKKLKEADHEGVIEECFSVECQECGDTETNSTKDELLDSMAFWKWAIDWEGPGGDVFFGAICGGCIEAINHENGVYDE